MTQGTNHSTPALSEAARHLVTPTGIVSTGFGRVRTITGRLGIRFDRWQEGIGQLMLAKRDDGTYAAGVGGVVMSICRQTGKTFTVGNNVVVLCLTQPGMKVIWTAHRTRTSSETFKTMTALVQRPGLIRHCKAVRRANGQEEIGFVNGSRILFGAREQGFGRGFDNVDMIIFDEAQILSEKALEDMIPTANAARNPLIVFMGTPPRPVDPGDVFIQKRAQALAGEDDMVYIEFSADRDASTDDRAQWAKANPSYPSRTKPAAMLRMLKNLGEDSFRREALGIWDEKATAGAIDQTLWEASAVERRMPGGWVAVGVDMPPDRSSLAVGACMGYEDGTAHIELARFRDSRRHGTMWAVDWIAERWPRLSAVVIDAQSPATVLVPELKERGVRVTMTNAAMMGQAVGRFQDMLRDHQLRHLKGQTPLDMAVAGATIRNIGHEGAYGWNKLGSDVDISPLVAATLALHGAMTNPRRETRQQRMIRLP
jgi:phage terminase large subunit-like protein